MNILDTFNTAKVKEYYYYVYPLAEYYKPNYWESLNYFYCCAPEEIKQYFGGIVPVNDGSEPPPLLSACTPIWFPKDAYAINLHVPYNWWIYPYVKGFPCYDKVELLHVRDDNPAYTVFGYWTYFAKGSGVFYNIGRTLSGMTKLNVLLKLGLSLDDVAGLIINTFFWLDYNNTQVSIRSHAQQLIEGSYDDITKVKMMIQIQAEPWRYKHMYSNRNLYLIDRINNSADWDGYITLLARDQGYDTIQFTCAANGNGGHQHEICFVGFPTLVKSNEITWPSWKQLLKRMTIQSPVSRHTEQCQFIPVDQQYYATICSQQPVSLCQNECDINNDDNGGGGYIS